MFCTRCGTELDDTDAYCSQCAKPTGLPPRVPPGGAPVRRLVRPMREKKIAGVCAGFARYLDADVTLVRVLWLVVSLLTGVGFIVYLIAWIAMPKDYGPAPSAAVQQS
jgi:phage shock protein C